MLVRDEIKTLHQGQAAVALRVAWIRFFGASPSNDSLALLWAQSALETGRWKDIHCYNYGNIKKRYANPKFNIEDDDHDWCMFRCNELINGKLCWFDPPHLQTHFRAYSSIEEGAEDYINFVANRERYKKAWKEVINGDPAAFSHELKVAGYYTASENLYTRGVIALTNEFKQKANELLSWPNVIVSDDSIVTLESILTDDEKERINGIIGLTLSESISNYFGSTDRYDNDTKRNPI
jgi:hypothetical protein